MDRPQLTTPTPKASHTWEQLEDFVREHVQQFIQALLEEEVTELLGRTKSARRDAVDATPGYRNGYGKPRHLTLTSGTITVRRPRVRDLTERFVSRVLPLFKRQTKEVGELLPQLYLHGLALGDFELALRGLLGEGAPLSPASLLRLKTQWQAEYEAWKQRRLDDLEVVYLWADGLYVKAGLEDTKAALLVMIGVLTNGQKVVLAVESGQRESKESWGMMLRDLRKRGLKPWRCTITAGHLGLWAALGEQYPTLAEQRCWNHKITNALDAIPKRYQTEARSLLCAMPYAETQAACEALRAEFTICYRKLAPKAVERLAEQLRVEKGLPSLQIRVGINTGEVVMRGVRKDDLHTDYTPIGYSTGLASRMEGLATPGSIVVSEQTYKLTQGYFAFKPLGAVRVKGVSEPVTIYEVVGVGPLRTRLQVATRRGFTRFVGRQSELEQLRRALAQATAGHGQIVGVMGEPGLGKSRLFCEFKLTSPSGALVLEAYSVSYGKASLYLPVIELLKSYFQLQPHDDERTRREKVGGKILMLDRRLEETLPYLFALLSIDDPTSSLSQMDPQIRRQRTLAALKQLFLRESLNQPLTLVFEDLHWIDTETQGFLDTLSESIASARLLLLVNYRPEYRHGWGQKTYYTQLRLAPLGKDEAEELLSFLLGNDTALKSLKQLLLEKTDGTPFFMEEVVQTLAEEGVLSGDRGQYRLEKAPTELHISPTVQGVLAARIDRLSREEKALLQQLAVIGREFPVSLVRQVLSRPEEELCRVLAALQNKEFLYEQPAFPEVEYHFKHALTQEVAYGTVLHERRKELHERVAQAIEVLWPEQAEERCSELAHHYRRSGNLPKAITYLHRAGQQAFVRSAYPEAIDAVREALTLLATQPNSAETARQELALQVTLGTSLRMAQGLSAEAEQAYARAEALCERVGETAQLFSLLNGLHSVFLLKGDFHRMQEVAQRQLQIAQDTANGTFLVEAYFRLGLTAFVCGEFVQARGYYEQCLQQYDPEHSGSLGLTSGTEVRAGSLSALAIVLWYSGFPDQGQQYSEEALRWASQPLQ